LNPFPKANRGKYGMIRVRMDAKNLAHLQN